MKKVKLQSVIVQGYSNAIAVKNAILAIELSGKNYLVFYVDVPPFEVGEITLIRSQNDESRRI